MFENKKDDQHKLLSFYHKVSCFRECAANVFQGSVLADLADNGHNLILLAYIGNSIAQDILI